MRLAQMQLVGSAAPPTCFSHVCGTRGLAGQSRAQTGRSRVCGACCTQSSEAPRARPSAHLSAQVSDAGATMVEAGERFVERPAGWRPLL